MRISFPGAGVALPGAGAALRRIGVTVGPTTFAVAGSGAVVGGTLAVGVGSGGCSSLCAGGVEVVGRSSASPGRAAGGVESAVGKNRIGRPDITRITALTPRAIHAARYARLPLIGGLWSASAGPRSAGATWSIAVLAASKILPSSPLRRRISPWSSPSSPRRAVVACRNSSHAVSAVSARARWRCRSSRIPGITRARTSRLSSTHRSTRGRTSESRSAPATLIGFRSGRVPRPRDPPRQEAENPARRSKRSRCEAAKDRRLRTAPTPTGRAGSPARVQQSTPPAVSTSAP